uniref:Chemokine interleukin-8-like domain-containing protein n=1 Tax=Paramormyrops kingsleyae TaxID=1676925 RepID=A0A3B3T432_9TELE
MTTRVSSIVLTSLITPLTPLHPTVQSVSSAALYCRCINTRPMVQQKRIRRLEVFPPAPHCSQTEIISGGAHFRFSLQNVQLGKITAKSAERQ